VTDEELLATPDSDLSAGWYLRKYRLVQKQNGLAGSAGRKNMTDADELYEVFCYYDKARKSSNQLVKHIRAEGTKCSNERSVKLFEEFTKKYMEKEDG